MWEKNSNRLAPIHTPTRDWTLILGVCPDQDSDLQPFSVWANTPINCATRPVQHKCLIFSDILVTTFIFISKGTHCLDFKNTYTLKFPEMFMDLPLLPIHSIYWVLTSEGNFLFPYSCVQWRDNYLGEIIWVFLSPHCISYTSVWESIIYLCR